MDVHQGEAVKINIGCGKQTWPDFFCIDAVQHPKASRVPDMLHAFTFDADGALENPIGLDDGCADEVHSYHFLEHVYRWEAPSLVQEWHRLLKPGGLLVLELPNIELAAKNLMSGLNDQMTMWPIYGDPGPRDPYMTHRWGYTPKTVRNLLADCGFSEIRLLPPVTHGAKFNRDMRIEAIKAVNFDHV